ncbi:MAG: tetratricopeptide repeat protein [Tepidisphaeraceae bacterium]|jgi:predicted O-linked N-acetylglucosamine transferase (SPINDLY family)
MAQPVFEDILREAIGHHQAGRLAQAVMCYRQALDVRPDSAAAHCNLGSALKSQGDVDGAIACFQRALALEPDAAEAHNNLGNACQQTGRLDEAVECYQQAIALRPDYAEAHCNLGGARGDQGQHDEAIACYREALRLKPESARIHSNLVYALHFHPASDRHSLYQEHRRWNDTHAAPLARLHRPHANDRSPDRPLRVGYVSPDFLEHPVGRFLRPLLAAHDRDQFRIFCYASQARHDSLTDRLRGHADVWRDVLALGDEQLAALIRDDAIDVLVDVTMHMAGSRLPVFARRPAPVQVTYLAYCATTGLGAIDYRLSTAALDPAGYADCCSEQTILLPDTYWCYEPHGVAPAVGEPPAGRRGQITFGCLNNFCKVTEPALETWSRLLASVGGSRLLLHSHPGGHRRRVADFLAARGIAPSRLTFAGFVPLSQYIEQYREIDIGLDPFPYGGGTTTCDALWMGVPVVSLAGSMPVSRSGLHLLSQVGLADLAAATPRQYVAAAAGLAADLPRLRSLRASLRQRLGQSPLMDAPRFARGIEAAYRIMWHRRCADPAC